MSNLIQRIGRKHSYKLLQSFLSTRLLTDRSFRLANALDIRAGQTFKTQISSGDYHPFMQTAQPKRQTDLTKQVLIDTRDSELDYKNGHIKDAVFLPRNRFDFYEYVDTKGGITFDEVYNTMREIGVCNETAELVLYDTAGENACRLYFVLRYFGFINVRILQGGYAGWKAAGLPEDTVDVTPKVSKELSLSPSRTYLVTRPTQMMGDFAARRSQIIDTRQAEHFKMNAMPRAINIPSTKFMRDGSFKSVKEIRDICRSEGFDVENNSKGPIILYSDKGRSSSIGYFALSMVGFDRLSIYDQGISNWELNQDTKLSKEQTDAFEK